MAAGPREQLDAEIAFEIGDVAADRRLRDAELARRGGEAAETRGDLEDGERVEEREVLPEAHVSSYQVRPSRSIMAVAAVGPQLPAM